MSRDLWYSTWQRAYIDLHAAYLGVLRLRHHRKKSAEHDITRDMGLLDPFDMHSASSAYGVRKWSDIWESHKGDDATTRVMSAAAEAIRDHWDSWSDFMNICPHDLRKFKITVPHDAFETSTAASREALEQRARVLAQAWERNLADRS
jgi:hypothetical protein